MSARTMDLIIMGLVCGLCFAIWLGILWQVIVWAAEAIR